MLRAHPLTDSYALPVPPLVLALAAGVVVLAVALLLPARRSAAATAPRGPGTPDPAFGDLSVPLSPSMLVGRASAVVVLVLAVTAGRLGSDDQLENLAPVLVVGLAWPLLFLAAAVLGPVWRYVDPWDALARLFGARTTGTHRGAVWPAVAIALPWLWYLHAYRGTLEPRSIGLALGLYTVVTLAGCLALGRDRWLSTAEPLGILLRWTGLLPRRALAGWQPPPGAGALLGVVAGASLFGVARRSELWGGLNAVAQADLIAAGGLLGACLVGAGLVAGARGLTPPRGDVAAVIRGVLPAVAAVVIAVGLERNRLTTSLQLLPEMLGDPFGRGWDLLGQGGGLDPAPFGIAGLMVVQLVVVTLGAVTGAAVTARRCPDLAARLPAALAVAVLADAAALLLTVH